MTELFLFYWPLGFDQVFEYRVDDFDTGFDGSGYGAGDLGNADAFAILYRDFLDSEALLHGFDLHFHRPAKIFIAHVELF